MSDHPSGPAVERIEPFQLHVPFREAVRTVMAASAGIASAAQARLGAARAGVLGREPFADRPGERAFLTLAEDEIFARMRAAGAPGLRVPRTVRRGRVTHDAEGECS